MPQPYLHPERVCTMLQNVLLHKIVMPNPAACAKDMGFVQLVYQQLHAWLPLLSISRVYSRECIQATTISTNCLQVGEAFADNKTVTVAKIDATANDVPSDKFSVGQFCSLAASIVDVSIGSVDHSVHRCRTATPQLVLHQPPTFTCKF